MINHSCDPNSECLKWSVNGDHRVGIFALKNIQPGEELTYNYRFESLANKPFKCLCGAERCPGWIGGRLQTTRSQQQCQEVKQKVNDHKPAELIRAFSQPKIVNAGALRNLDGSRKTAEDLKTEEVNALSDRLDWFLSHLFSRPGNFFPFLALDLSDFEADFIRARRIFIVRNFVQSKHAVGRKICAALPDDVAADTLTSANLLGDDKCARCRRAGLLRWCKCCMRPFHGSCLPYGSSTKNGELLNCGSCVRFGPPRAGKIGRILEKRKDIWLDYTLPMLLRRSN